MHQDLEQKHAPQESESFVGLIARTAVKTLYYAVVFALVLVTIFVLAFPYRALRQYEKLGMDRKALEMSEIWIHREAKKGQSAFSGYADALQYKMDLAQKLFEQSLLERSADLSLAKKLQAGSRSYALISGIDARFAAQDKASLEHLPALLHVYQFSAKDIVYRQNYIANVYLGQSGQILSAGEELPIGDVFALLDSISDEDLAAYDGSLASKPEYLDDGYLFLNQLAEYIAIESKHNGFADVELPSERKGQAYRLFSADEWAYANLLEQRLAAFRDFALHYADNHQVVSAEMRKEILLKQLYYVRAIGRILDGMEDISIAHARNQAVWDNLNQTNIAGSDYADKAVSEYFLRKLLPDYIKYVMEAGF